MQSLPLRYLAAGLFLIITAVLSLIWTPFDLILEERLRMRPGLPAYDLWLNPPDIIRLELYIFNITNAEEFLNGEDEKLRYEEVGPLIFKMNMSYSDIVFNSNSTLSYTFYRSAILDTSMTTTDLNATIMFPNVAVLMTASLHWNSNYLLKSLLNYLFDKTKSKLIVKKTIYEVLFNNTDRFLSTTHSMFPYFAKIDNIGIMPVVYDERVNRITVFIGTKYGHERFFLIDKYNGVGTIPGRGDSCKDSIVNTSNSYVYSQKLPKSRVVRYFDPVICKTLSFNFEGETYRYGIKAYRFVMSKDTYNRTQPAEDDCYKGVPPLPDGLSDLSPCWFSYPIAGSNPHFLYGSEDILNAFDGIEPNVNEHESYTIMEPVTGLNLESGALIQANLHVRPLNDFHEMFDKFSDKVLPLIYSRCTSKEIPYYIILYTRILLALPITDAIFTSILFLCGAYCIWTFKRKTSWKRKQFHRKIEEKIKKEKRTELESFIATPNEFITEEPLDRTTRQNRR